MQATEYYYDPLGREIFSVRPNSQGEQYTLDAADNRSVLNAFTISSPNQAGLLNTNQSLQQGQSVTSTDGRFSLAFQSDGNLVLYQGSTALWNSGTNSTTAAFVEMQAGGALVIINPQGIVLWSSGSGGKSGGYLNVLTNGNMVIYAGGAQVWQTNTCCH